MSPLAFTLATSITPQHRRLVRSVAIWKNMARTTVGRAVSSAIAPNVAVTISRGGRFGIKYFPPAVGLTFLIFYLHHLTFLDAVHTFASRITLSNTSERSGLVAYHTPSTPPLPAPLSHSFLQNNHCHSFIFTFTSLSNSRRKPQHSLRNSVIYNYTS